MILTLTEAKEAARVLHDDDDLLIQAYADAAQIWIERVTGKTFDPAPEDVKQIARMLVDSASWQPVVTTRSLALNWQPESSISRAICSRNSRVPWMLS